MHTTVPKYSLPEIERRWLVNAAALPPLQPLPWRWIEDKYIHGGRLRLRKMASVTGETVYKFGKKYESPVGQPEQIVNIYLTAEEFEILALLPGREARKKRYSVEGGCLDIYEMPQSIPPVFEMEFRTTDAAEIYTPPPFVGGEITGHAKYSGFSLAGTAA